MIWYVLALGAAVLVFGGVASLIFLALSSNRRRSTATLPQTTQPQPVSQQESDWEKWGKRFGWVFFVYVVWDLCSKFVSPRIPNEWKEWAPSFSWNTLEIIVVLVGVYFLWGKRNKKPTSSGGGVAEQGGEAGVPCNHLSPAQITGKMYNGVPQVKWVRTGGESFWIAFAIIVMICLVFGGIMYSSGGVEILRGFGKQAMQPILLSRGVMILLFVAILYPLIKESERVFVLWFGILSVIVGTMVYGWNWFIVPLDINTPWWMGGTAPAVFVVLPMILVSATVLWKTYWADWITPGVFAVVWFVFIVLVQNMAVSP
jgi:hypothetical protein